MKDTAKIYFKAKLIRIAEEKLLELFSQGKLNGTVHTCLGSELVAVTICENLTNEDTVFSNHRGHGHFIAKTGDLKGLFAEIMGKENGVCGGIGGSQHLCSKGFFSNGIQGGMVPISIGYAFSQKYFKTNGVSVSFIGDGTFGQGIIYESFNIASKWELPVIIVVENNGIAQSTFLEQTMAGNIQKRADAFNIKYLHSNVWNLEELMDCTEQAVKYVRENKKPLIIEIETYRLFSHSKGDDNRAEEEINFFREKDLINLYYKEPTKTNELNRIDEIISEAVQFAEHGEVLSEIYKPTNNQSIIYHENKTNNVPIRGNESIYNALKVELQSNPTSILIGEDIEATTEWTPKEYGGAFKVTKNLSSLFPQQVKNTPISEPTIVGMGAGMALGGMNPVVEIMFGDFTTLILDQLLQHACKFKSMYNNQVTVPLVIRTPMGGRRGYGPTHSQSLEKHFFGIPDLTLVALNNRLDVELFYSTILKEKSPIMVIENKILYSKIFENAKPSGFSVATSNEKYPTIKITTYEKKPSVVIFCYGEMLCEAEIAIQVLFDEMEIICEIVCPSQISPLNNSLIKSVDLINKKVVVVEEGNTHGGFGSEVAAQILDSGIQISGFARLGNNHIIPSSIIAEKNSLPDSIAIINKVKQLINGRK